MSSSADLQGARVALPEGRLRGTDRAESIRLLADLISVVVPCLPSLIAGQINLVLVIIIVIHNRSRNKSN